MESILPTSELEWTFHGEAMRYRVSTTEVGVGNFKIRLQCIKDIETAIDEMFQELQARGCGNLLEELCPYFGTLWPSAQVLAQWVWEQGVFAFRQKRVLELGCGLALPSFVASHFQADVLATDLHPDVPEFLSRNLVANPGTRIRYKHLDWRDNTRLKSSERYYWILASDVMYESHQAGCLIDFILHNLAREGTAVITDPDRSYWSTLVRMAKEAGLEVSLEERPMVSSEGQKCLLISLRHPGVSTR
jgi:ETFB lysine methyltransferase